MLASLAPRYGKYVGDGLVYLKVDFFEIDLLNFINFDDFSSFLMISIV